MTLRTTQRIALLCMLGLSFLLHGAEKPSPGRTIYVRQCAKCHGRNGEGVKGKYEDALHGHWSVEKLTRYISKNMPEDDPGSCTGPQAEEVARYVHDTLYTKHTPPRVELARLTNRQYVNTVADLVRNFTGTDQPPGPDRGLHANYYNSQGFNDAKKVITRIDPQIDFNYGTNTPDARKLTTNEFAMNWRGSLIAEETGEYEFLLKSPNGVRLWINNDEDPAIDAWVASGQATEHRATIRLIGGRAYPLKLDFFKFKDKTASISLLWKPPHGALMVIPERNLSPDRTTRTFVVTTPFPPDDSSVGYERGVSISKEWDEAATHAAIEVANYVTKHLDGLTKSKPTDADRTNKVEAFCRDWVATAFRRPLNEEQTKLYVASQFKKGMKTEESVKRVVLLSLKSPRFLYLGLDGRKPDDFDVAARLSFALCDSMPDRELTKVAAQGMLHTREQIGARAQEMLKDPRTHAKVLTFFQHWLQMNHVEDFSKDPSLYPGFSPEIIADLRTSLNLFVSECFWSKSSDYRSLLLADYLFLNGRLAKFYDIKTRVTNNFVKVSLDSDQRSGVVTHPYLLSEFSYQKSSSPIHRGVFLSRNIVGRALKPPPMAVAFKDAEFDPKLTMREKVTALTSPNGCQTCHSVINPLGFSLERYDAVGKYRIREKNRVIDALSEYVSDEGEKVSLSGPRDIAEFAIASEPAQNAFIEQLFHQVVKQPILAYGEEMIDRLRQSFVASRFNMQRLLVDITTVSALYHLENPMAGRKTK